MVCNVLYAESCRMIVSCFLCYSVSLTECGETVNLKSREQIRAGTVLVGEVCILHSARVRNQQVLAMLPSVTEVHVAKCALRCTQGGTTLHCGEPNPASPLT